MKKKRPQKTLLKKKYEVFSAWLFHMPSDNKKGSKTFTSILALCFCQSFHKGVPQKVGLKLIYSLKQLTAFVSEGEYIFKEEVRDPIERLIYSPALAGLPDQSALSYPIMTGATAYLFLYHFYGTLDKERTHFDLISRFFH